MIKFNNGCVIMAMTWGQFKQKVNKTIKDNQEIDWIDTGNSPDDIFISISAYDNRFTIQSD
jgi:hypothetical protein